MKKTLSGFATLAAFLLTSANLQAAPFTSLYAFGDSLSDAGGSASAVMSIYKFLGNNCDPSHPCPPYYDGRYSNGQVAVEYLANAVLPGGASSSNFYNFAVSGATTGIGNYGDGGSAGGAGMYGLPGIAQEIGFYLSSSGGAADPNALYFLWGGANDFLTLDSPIAAAQHIAEYAAALATAGARHILVPNLPDLSLTPFVAGAGLQGVAQAFSIGFNTELALQLNNLDGLFPASDIIQFDTFSFLNDIVMNPVAYGFSNATDACLPSPVDTPCADPENHVFWDGFHPTTQSNSLIASAFARAVPEPGTVVLFMAGLFAMGMAGRRQGRFFHSGQGV